MKRIIPVLFALTVTAALLFVSCGQGGLTADKADSSCPTLPNRRSTPRS